MDNDSALISVLSPISDNICSTSSLLTLNEDIEEIQLESFFLLCEKDALTTEKKNSSEGTSTNGLSLFINLRTVLVTLGEGMKLSGGTWVTKEAAYL